jgi:Clp amino terminal domain, pathogenicity island component
VSGAGGRHTLAPRRRAVGSADPLLVAILGQWEEEQAGGPALLRACGMTADQASQLAATLLPPEPAEAAVPEAEPRVIGTLRFVVDQAWRIAAEARAPDVGTEHLVVAMLWQDTFIGAHELRRLGISHTRAAEQLPPCPITNEPSRSIRWRRRRRRPRRRPSWASWPASRPANTRSRGRAWRGVRTGAQRSIRLRAGRSSRSPTSSTR